MSSWDSTASIVALVNLGIVVLVTGMGKKISVLQVSRLVLGPIRPPIQWVLEALPGNKAATV